MTGRSNGIYSTAVLGFERDRKHIEKLCRWRNALPEFLNASGRFVTGSRCKLLATPLESIKCLIEPWNVVHDIPAIIEDNRDAIGTLRMVACDAHGSILDWALKVDRHIGNPATAILDEFLGDGTDPCDLRGCQFPARNMTAVTVPRDRPAAIFAAFDGVGGVTNDEVFVLEVVDFDGDATLDAGIVTVGEVSSGGVSERGGCSGHLIFVFKVNLDDVYKPTLKSVNVKTYLQFLVYYFYSPNGGDQK